MLELEYEKMKFKNKLRDNDIKKILQTFQKGIEEENYSKFFTINQIIDKDYNIGFLIDSFKFERKIASISSKYKDFKKYMMKDISVDIKRIQENIEYASIGNEIYIPVIGNSPVVYLRKDTKVKDHNLVLVTLDSSIVLAEYLSSFPLIVNWEKKHLILLVLGLLSNQ